jgi:hypothetical protein
MASYDVLRPVQSLANFDTYWDTDGDERPHRLVLYGKSTRHVRDDGWVKGTIVESGTHLYGTRSQQNVHGQYARRPGATGLS